MSDILSKCSADIAEGPLWIFTEFELFDLGHSPSRNRRSSSHVAPALPLPPPRTLTVRLLTALARARVTAR